MNEEKRKHKQKQNGQHKMLCITALHQNSSQYCIRVNGLRWRGRKGEKPECVLKGIGWIDGKMPKLTLHHGIGEATGALSGRRHLHRMQCAAPEATRRENQWNVNGVFVPNLHRDIFDLSPRTYVQRKQVG